MNNVAALILCLGQATRMRPLSIGTPKSLLKFCQRPLLEYTLERLLAEGIGNIAIVAGVGVTGFDAYLSWGRRHGANMLVVHRHTLGSGEAVREVITHELAQQLPQVEQFLIVYGDSLVDFAFADMVRAHRCHAELGALITVACHQPDDLVIPGQVHTNYGILAFGRQGRIVQFREKPTVSEIRSPYASAGVFLMGREALELFPGGRTVDLSKDVIAPVTSGTTSPIFGYDISPGYRYDIGTLDEYRQRQLDVVHGRLTLGGVPQPYSGEHPPPFARCAIGGHALIAPGCSIADDATLAGGNVIGEGVSIGKGCVVEDSIVLDNAWLGPGAHISRSIIGPSARVTGGLVLENSVVGGWSVVSNGWNG